MENGKKLNIFGIFFQNSPGKTGLLPNCSPEKQPDMAFPVSLIDFLTGKRYTIHSTNLHLPIPY